MANTNSETPPADADPTVAEFIEDIRVSILVIAGALLRSGAVTQELLNSEAQAPIDSVGGRALRSDVFPVLHQLANISLLQPPTPGRSD